MRTLRQIRELYKPKSPDEQRFVDKHKVQKTPDANKNGDDVFNASKVKGVTRQPNHGYNPGDDEKVYEEVEQVDERCWKGYKPVPGKKPYSPGSCKKEEVEQVDEITKAAQKRLDATKQHLEKMYGDHIKSVYSSGRGMVTVTTHNGATHEISAKDTGGKMPSPGEHIGKYIKEEVEQVDEVLKPSMGASKYIRDFVDSKNPKFAGKSKKERIDQALAAYYSAKKGEK